ARGSGRRAGPDIPLADPRIGRVPGLPPSLPQILARAGMTPIAVARQHDSLGGKLGAISPQGMLQKRRARLWLADVHVNTAATRHLPVPGPPAPHLRPR